LHIELAQRIHEECGAASDFITQHGNAGAGHIKRFDDDVFQFVAQKLFDGAFVFLTHLGVIGEHANGTEAGGFISALARRE